MIKELKFQIAKMFFAFALLGLLAAWQFDFVMEAIQANIFLNATIIGVFLFGSARAFIEVFGLENEILAFQSLQEEFDDTRNIEEKEKNDPLWKFYRANDLAIVYKRPKILAHAHLLIQEQIARFKKVSISPSNVVALLDGVDARLSDKKNSLQFTAGLLIFLGLIGTFVGLMGTLASVSGILGTIDLTGDAAESVQLLMDKLQEPLKGMATGFSSSLFGLVTSLTLSIMARFSSASFGSLRMNLEEWLTAVGQLAESEKENEASKHNFSSSDAQNNNQFGIRELAILLNAARHNIAANGRTRQQIGAMADVLEKVVQNNLRQDNNYHQLLLLTAKLVEQNEMVMRSVDHYGQQVEERLKINDAMVKLEQRLCENQVSIEERITERQNRTQRLIENVSADLNTHKLIIAGENSDIEESEAQLLNELRESYQDLKQKIQKEDELNQQNESSMQDLENKNLLKQNDLEISKAEDTHEIDKLRGRIASELNAELSNEDISKKINQLAQSSENKTGTTN